MNKLKKVMKRRTQLLTQQKTNTRTPNLQTMKPTMILILPSIAEQHKFAEGASHIANLQKFQKVLDKVGLGNVMKKYYVLNYRDVWARAAGGQYQGVVGREEARGAGTGEEWNRGGMERGTGHGLKMSPRHGMFRGIGRGLEVYPGRGLEMRRKRIAQMGRGRGLEMGRGRGTEIARGRRTGMSRGKGGRDTEEEGGVDRQQDTQDKKQDQTMGSEHNEQTYTNNTFITQNYNIFQ